MLGGIGLSVAYRAIRACYTSVTAVGSAAPPQIEAYLAGMQPVMMWTTTTTTMTTTKKKTLAPMVLK
jgi:hypothetical protein